MKITEIKVNQIRSEVSGLGGGLFVRIFTDEGIIGIAEGTGNLRVFKSYVNDMIKPLIVGMSPLQPKRIWEILSQGIREQATNFPSQIVGAIDVACWDIMGKAAGLPLNVLLGGAKKREIPLYWSRGGGWRKEPEEMLEEIQEGYEKGYRAFKVRMDWRSYRQDINPQKDLSIFQKCREWLPDDVPLGFDANCVYSVPTAIKQGVKLQEMGVSHFEEPLSQHDFPGLKQVVDSLHCPVSTGEQEISAWRFRDLLLLGNPDILQPDILNVGGLSEVIRVYELAAANNKIVMPHSPTIGANSLASIHAYSTVSNAVRPHEFSEEFSGPVEKVASLFVDPIIPVNGSISLTDRPGIGVELDEKILDSLIVD